MGQHSISSSAREDERKNQVQAPVKPITLSRSGGVSMSYPRTDELKPGAYSSIKEKHLFANNSCA